MSEKLTDLSAERAVLSGMFMHGENAYLDISDILQPSTFTDPINEALYKVFAYLIDEKQIKTLDNSSVMAGAKELNLDWIFEKPEDLKHIRSIINGRVLLENVRVWAAKIRKLEIARLLKTQLLDACMSLDDLQGNETIDHILGIAENSVFDFTSLLQSSVDNEPELLKIGLCEYLTDLENNPSTIVGISSGYKYYDKAIGGGFRRKTVSMIGARVKIGKSILAINVALHVAALLGIPVLYLDTEMKKEDHWSRVLPNLAHANNIKVTIDELESGQYAKNEWHKRKIREVSMTLDNTPFYYHNISGKPFEEILSIVRRWTTKTVGCDENGKRKDCLVIYDYMKLMSGEGLQNLQEYQMLGFMATSLHNLAVKQDIAVLSFVQLNRDGIDSESTASVSGSDRILWIATNFSIYKPKTDEEIAEFGLESGTRKLIPVVARHGEGLQYGDYINMVFHNKFARVVEGETHHNMVLKKSNPPPPPQQKQPLIQDSDAVDLNEAQSELPFEADPTDQ